MRRRELIIGSAAMTLPCAVKAQQRKLPVVGFVDRGPENGLNDKAFRQGLADAGIVIGRDVTIEHRRIIANRSKELVLDLVERGVAVIVAAGGSGAAAAEAKEASSTVPIVFVAGANPVRSGLVASLSRPGGNVTGVTFLSTELTGKRLDLLHKLIPQATKVGYLSFSTTGPAVVEQREDAAAAARMLGQELVTINYDTRIGTLQNAFETMARAGVEAVLVETSPFLITSSRLITNLAARHKLPTIYFSSVFARAGGLISYSADISAGFHLAGYQYVARILKGTKPADLPVQQPTKFELVINLTTARTLGIDVPPSLLAIADEVIE